MKGKLFKRNLQEPPQQDKHVCYRPDTFLNQIPTIVCMRVWRGGLQGAGKKNERQKWRGHNKRCIVKSLPTKQSPSMQMSLQLPVDRDLFDGPHAEYEAANSLISILHG